VTRPGRPAPAILAATVVLAASLALGPGDGGAQRFVPQRDPAHPKLKYADSLVSINDRCAVREGALSPSIRPVYVNGRPVGFCCTGCPPVFVQGPEPYLLRMKARFSDPVEPGRPARIVASLRYHVNWEIYYFADRAHLEQFRRHPTRYAGWITDPVSGVRFRADEKSPQVRHAGRPFFFTSDSTRAKFQARPLDYALRKGA
jgi:YHS domain-containing protein